MGIMGHRGSVLLLVCACVLPAQTRRDAGAYDAAVAARATFESAPSHTKDEYAQVMDGFRAIYHANPADVNASRAVAAVAELLAEQGKEFHDAKSTRDAAGQYDFLRKNYPASKAARDAKEITLDSLTVDSAKAWSTETGAQAKVQSSEDAEAKTASKPADGPASVASADHYVPPSKRRSAQPVSEDAALAEEHQPNADAAPIAPKKGTLATVSGIRHWSTPTYTRVAIDLGDEVEYQAARVENPDRIYFDLHHSKLAHELVGKSFAVNDDGFLTKIRAAQYSNDVTRVVLDVHEVSEYSAFLLPNPYRLIIDIHGKEQGTGSKERGAESGSSAPVESSDTRTSKGALRDAPSSSTLPAMSVTDGSSDFGLPSRRSATNANVAAPRVVIPQKATPSKPVPNATETKSADSSVELAAVSSQPGRVEATKRPTSAPVAERTKSTGRKHEVGAPAEVAPPTADGETSLMRALGLKIGRIVIDAGHGGHDSGTLGAGGIEEKDVVLDVALKLGKLLHDRLGAEIVYTRADDTFIPLETRTAIANKAQADLFISVHANSSQDADARGVEVYYLNFTSDPDATRVASRENASSTQSVHELSDLVKKIALKDKIDESKELAGDVDQSLYAGLEKGNAGLKNRGVKKAPFVVLIGANMPSILAEISFVTNPKDAAQLQTQAYRERVAESLYRGVELYAKGINGSRAHEETMERAGR